MSYEKRVKAGTIVGTSIGALKGILKARKQSTGKWSTVKDHTLKGAVGGAAVGHTYHHVYGKKKDRHSSLQTDGSNLSEQFGLAKFVKKKASGARETSQKLSKDLKMLASWYERLATMSGKTATFIDKHPYVASTLHWGASKFLKPSSNK